MQLQKTVMENCVTFIVIQYDKLRKKLKSKMMMTEMEGRDQEQKSKKERK